MQAALEAGVPEAVWKLSSWRISSPWVTTHINEHRNGSRILNESRYFPIETWMNMVGEYPAVKHLLVYWTAKALQKRGNDMEKVIKVMEIEEP